MLGNNMTLTSCSIVSKRLSKAFLTSSNFRSISAGSETLKSASTFLGLADPLDVCEKTNCVNQINKDIC